MTPEIFMILVRGVQDSEVNNLSKTKLSVYASLGSAKMRRKHGLFIVEGEKCVADTMHSFTPEAIIVRKGAYAVDELMRMGYRDISRYEADGEQMHKLSNLSTPSDVVGVFRLPESSSDSDLKVDEGLYIVLDGVQDPGNLGTIVRTCHWFGIFRLFASRDTVDIFNPKAIQATMGSVGRVEVTYCDLNVLLDSNPDMPVYGTLLEGEDIFSAALSKNGFIIMGNEGNGISKGMRERISRPLFIPPAGADHSESLNVSIATAVVVAQFVR